MKNPYQRKAASKNQSSSIHPQESYKAFIESMLQNNGIYALYQDGFALCATPTGQKALAIWRHINLAKLVVKDNWANYQPMHLSFRDFIEKVLPHLNEEQTMVSLDLSPEGQNMLITPEKMLLDIKNYLYQVYLQRPEIFEQLNIPLPRQIRLH